MRFVRQFGQQAKSRLSTSARPLRYARRTASGRGQRLLGEQMRCLQ